MKRSSWVLILNILFLSMAVGCGSGGGSRDSSPHTVGGTVGGLAGTVVLQLNGGNDLTITQDGAFTFPNELANGTAYTVTVKTQPAGRFCSIANATGTIDGENVTSVHVNGQLDPAFSTDGMAISSQAAGGQGDTAAHAMVVDGDGKIVVAGESVNASGNADMTIWRYNADGTLDTSFGGDGIVVYPGTHGDDAGYAVTIDGSSKILVTGVLKNSSGNFDMAIWRYNTDGSPDATFNGNGHTIYNYSGFATSNDEGRCILLDGTDILVAGSIQNMSNSDMAIWRYTTNGTPDNSFGASGIATFSGGYGNDYANSMALASSGKILVTGVTANISGNLDMTVWRYDSIGLKDLAFGGGDGAVVYNGTYGNDAGNSICLDGSGRILVTGYSQNSSGDYDMMIWRYAADGSALDSTFGTNGLVRSNNAAGGNGHDYGFFITRDASGKILVAGSSQDTYGSLAMALWRCTATGAPDTTFGINGIVVNDNAAGGGKVDSGSAIAIDPDDPDKRIYAAGYSENASEYFDMVLWRFYPE